MDMKPRPPETIKSPMEICWQFSYEIDSDKLSRLYSKSKKLQWDAERDIDWDTPVDPSRPLIDEDRFGLTQLPFIQRMSKTQQDDLRAHIAAMQLSQFLHGEQGALMTAAALTHAVPDYEGKLYAATQTMDEARHVEVYDRYIKKIALIYPMNDTLKGLIDATLSADHWVKIAIGMNMVVEGLALGAFHNMRKATSCELLRSIIEGVLRDEARHVAFGNLYVPGFLLVLENVGIDPMDFAKGVMEARTAGQKIQPPADQVHAYRDLMMPALVRVGVVTDRVRERYDEAGIKIFEDARVLESLEDADTGVVEMN